MSMSGALYVRKRPIALTRRSGIPPCGIADCAPVQCCVRPVLAPAQAFVRAGERRGNAEFGMRTRRGRLIRAVRMFCARRVCFYGSAGVVALDVRQSLRFCSGRLRLASGRICGSVAAVCSARVRPYGFVAAFCLGSRLSFFLCQEKRDGLRYLAFLFRRVEIAIRAFSWCRCGYLPWRVHFGLVRFFMAIPTGNRGHEEWGYGRTGYGVGGAAFVRFYAATLALLCFPPGVRWGCAPQTCAKESSTLWTLFRGWPSERVRFTRPLLRFTPAV